eukprot:CAMPEP_0172536710 /NCGR_PEP_ID=MMETSP1067-20121228/8434_1 /TAXON_ID=265564 ORGANISM="Thalassiosira punctigera, Strain Tpunct2005C2" /NCGR_SAMPLE_ID=MMETSP1067 /ASSEMBLY_ACC=CAM_ASM_000444 /LENGTH=57 /DNA_ID=CAMNT_0013321849 /DNA_START=2436 /DNA_END=2609 /DNA_ORIENTATION=+
MAYEYHLDGGCGYGHQGYIKRGTMVCYSNTKLFYPLEKVPTSCARIPGNMKIILEDE